MCPMLLRIWRYLLTEDSLEMIEDLEFYSWIDFDAEAIDSDGPTNNVG